MHAGEKQKTSIAASTLSRAPVPDSSDGAGPGPAPTMTSTAAPGDDFSFSFSYSYAYTDDDDGTRLDSAFVAFAPLVRGIMVAVVAMHGTFPGTRSMCSLYLRA